MLHMICLTIVHGECWPSESPRKSPSLNSVRERWPGNLVECSAHRIISQAFGKWAPVSVLMVAVLIIWERLTRRSLWSRSVIIISTIRRNVRVWRSPSALFANLLHKWSISSCMVLVSFSWGTWLPLLDWLLLVWVVCTLTSQSLLHSRLRKWSWH